MNNIENFDVEKIILLGEIDAQRDKISECKIICLKYFKFYNEKGFTLFVFLSIWFYLNFIGLVLHDNIDILIVNSCIFLLYLLVFMLNYSSRTRLLNAVELLDLVLIKNNCLKKIVIESDATNEKIEVFKCLNAELTDIFVHANSVAIMLNTASIGFLVFNSGMFLYINSAICY